MKTQQCPRILVCHLFLAVALCAGLSGCLAPVTSGISAERGHLVFENAGFASRIEAVQDKTVMTDGGFLKAQVSLRNREQRDIRAQYRFTWKDKDGLVLTSADTVWTPLPLYGREEAVVEAICPVPGAADFRLVLRPL